MKILLKYTSKNRPERFFTGLNSIITNLSDKENYHIQCTFDLDDAAYNNEVFKSRLDGYKNLTYFYGTSTGKVNAINRDIDKFPAFDILINFSDDIVISFYGFDDVIRQAMQKYFPDTDGFIHAHDGNQNRLSIMSIEGKKFFDRFGNIYHNDYVSVWCDVERQEVAKKLGKYKYLGDEVKMFTHFHPLHGHQQYMDEFYTYDGKFFEQDRQTYFRRLANNFDL